MTPPSPGSSPAATVVSPDAAAGDDPGIGPSTLERRRQEVLEQLPAPAPAAGTELFGATPGSGYRRPPSLVRRSDGQTIQLTPLLYAVLEAIDGERSYERIATHVSERTGRTATAADVLYLIEGKLRPLGLLRAPDGTEPTLPRANPLLALRCRFVISDPDRTRRITRPFAALFRPSVILLTLAAFLWTTWYVVVEQGLAASLHQAFYEPHLLLLVFALTLVSAGFHEFGHAAACRYGGATPGAMGFGLYLVWPAFYTDVTDSYRLGRAGRLRVDLGGLYFNAVFAVATFGVWAWLQADALLLLIVAQLLQMSRQLAPLVRFDGYHILADLIGVPDLFAHIKPTLMGLLPTRWRHGQHAALAPWARVAVTLWVALVVPLLTVLLVTMVLIVPRLAATAWDALGVQWEVLGANWADQEYARVGVRLLSIVSLCLPVLTVSYLLARVARRTATRLWAASAGSRWRRGGVVLMGVAAVAGLAWLWWPQGQYTPIDADERGPLPGLVAPETVPAGEPEHGGPPVGAAPPAVAGPAAGGGIVATSPPTVPGAAVPELGVVLVPRSSDGGHDVASDLVHVLVPGDGDGDDAPTTGLDPSTPPDEWPFPWHAPPPAGEGDNRAIVVNTEDGSTVYDVALAFVWVTDGGPVDERNEAFAYASCRDCESTAVAFQVVLIVGQADVITPVNSAVAANFACDSCRTHALAMQLIATIRALPDDAVLDQLGQVWADVELLEEAIETTTIEEVYLRIKHAEARILTILDGADVDEAADELAEADGPDAEASPEPATEDPVADEPSADDPTPDDPAAPTAGTDAADEPTTDEPGAEEEAPDDGAAEPTAPIGDADATEPSTVEEEDAAETEPGPDPSPEDDGPAATTPDDEVTEGEGTESGT